MVALAVVAAGDRNTGSVELRQIDHIMKLSLFIRVLCGSLLYFCSAEADDDEIELRIINNPGSGVILHKTMGPLEEGPVGSNFPGVYPARFIRQAFDIDAPTSLGGKKIIANQTDTCGNLSLLDEQFGAAIVSRAKEMFAERGCQDELESFFQSGVSNPEAGPRRMHWTGLHILPNQSLALHSHPNIEFAYIVEGVMHEHRIVDHSIAKKKKYVPVEVKGANGETRLSYQGPDHLADIDARKDGVFRHTAYTEGEMFINTIGDVHQSYTAHEGVKLFVIWGDGNAVCRRTSTHETPSS